MHRDNTNTLYQAYPALFRDRHFEQMPIAYGIACGDGWFGLIDDLCRDLMTLCRDNELAVPEVVQVKQKLGGLRFYLESGDAPVIDDRIQEAERLSFKTCELCGGAGRLGRRNDYWCVRCEPCAAAEDADPHGRTSARPRRRAGSARWRPVNDAQASAFRKGCHEAMTSRPATGRIAATEAVVAHREVGPPRQ